MTQPRIGELFAGYGGLGMGVQEVFGGDVVWFSEIDPAPSKVLAHHWPAIPNHGDITKIDWGQVEPVDILTGGFPCQDVSLAGNRAGIKDGTRSGLWSEFARAIEALRPGLVVIENVRGLLSAQAHSDMEPCPWCMGDGADVVALRAFGAVLADLAVLGYVGRSVGVRAADAGAPHGRYRVFIVAENADNPVGGEWWESASREAEERGSWADVGGRGGASAADPEHDGASASTGGGGVGAFPAPGRHERFEEGADLELAGEGRVRVAADSGGDRLGGYTELDSEQEESEFAAPLGEHADRRTIAGSGGFGGHEGDDFAGQQGEGPDGSGVVDERGSRSGAVEWGVYESAIRRWERTIGRVAPAPTNPDGKNGSHRLSSRFVEWMMGLPAGHVTSVGLTRNEELKALGNGVVPQQAALALGVLARGMWGAR